MKAMRALVVVALFTLTGAAQAADVAAGQAKAATCAACHGQDGNSPTAMFPKLAGQVPDYIVKQLSDFKRGKRRNPLMSGMVTSLSKADMQNLAAYFAKQKPELGVAAGSKDSIAIGEKLYRGGDRASGIPACMACHGPTGIGLPPYYPRLSGQWAAYTEAQLLAFKRGTRTNDNGTMSVITARMTSNQIKAVSQYVAGLH